ncbi:MAG: helix-turn-helix transcriptional regulator [Polyangiaceae bacterium]
MGRSEAAQRSQLGEALRRARQATGLTQQAFGRSLQLSGRAVYRWERNASRPSSWARRRILELLGHKNQAAAAELAAAFARARSFVPVPPAAPAPAPPPQAPVVPPAPPPPVAPPVPPDLIASAVEVAVLRAADELDISPRRLRGALARLCRRLAEAGYSLERAATELEGWSRVATSTSSPERRVESA